MTTVKESLAEESPRRVFFDRLGGNHGDRLILEGALLALRESGITLVDSPGEAEAIILNGGGSMTDFWTGVRAIEGYNRRFPDTPLVVLPSTFFFWRTDFASLFESRRAAATLFCRERFSLATLCSTSFPPAVRVALDHDMAFHLANTEALDRLREEGRLRHILIVERLDPESPTQAAAPRQCLSRAPASIRGLVPVPIKRILRRAAVDHCASAVWAETPFAREAIATVRARYPWTEKLPVYAADISRPYFFSYARFRQLIRDAAVIVTTRLHVGILGAMLGKNVLLYGGPKYYKIRGVYEYSLQAYSNVSLYQPSGASVRETLAAERGALRAGACSREVQ